MIYRSMFHLTVSLFCYQIWQPGTWVSLPLELWATFDQWSVSWMGSCRKAWLKHVISGSCFSVKVVYIISSIIMQAVWAQDHILIHIRKLMVLKVMQKGRMLNSACDYYNKGPWLKELRSYRVMKILRPTNITVLVLSVNVWSSGIVLVVSIAFPL